MGPQRGIDLAITAPVAELLRWMAGSDPTVRSRPDGTAGQRRLYTVLQVAALAPLAGGVAWLGEGGPALAAMMAQARPDLRSTPAEGLPDVVACVDGELPDGLAAAVRGSGLACWWERSAGRIPGGRLGARGRRVCGLDRWGYEAWWVPGRHAPGPPPRLLAGDEAEHAAVDRMVRRTTRTPQRDLRV